MKQYSLAHQGHQLVEFDNSPMFWHRVPLAVDALVGGFGPKGARLAARPGVSEAIPFQED